MKSYISVAIMMLSILLFSAPPTGEKIENLTSWHEMKRPLFLALQKAGDNSQELVEFIKQYQDSSKKRATIFLVSYMPERDLMTLSSEFLAKNLEFAFKAREEFEWCKNLPEAIFFNDVLPYAVLNERRDSWREDFYQKFSKLIKNCKTTQEAAETINRDIAKIVNVKYSTKRKKADQSPYESIESGLASCSGLSILLANAFRSVGIPARIAGIPEWVNKRGNHTWNEVMIDGKWRITEYYFDQKGFDHGWFLSDVAYADQTKWQHKIYASSFKPTEFWFPLVWDFNIRFVHGIDRTKHYKELGESTIKISKNHQTVAIVAKNSQGERVVADIEILLDGKRVAFGKTKGELNDANDMLQFPLEVNKSYTIICKDQQKAITVTKKSKVQIVDLSIN